MKAAGHLRRIVVGKSPLNDLGAIVELFLAKGLRWPDIQWVIDADWLPRNDQKGMGCVVSDARSHRRGLLAVILVYVL